VSRATIAILEDDPRRVRTMRRLLGRAFPGFAVVVSDNAPDLIEWLRANLTGVALIALDHDLGPERERDGCRFDPGTGRDVADYLATVPPSCPVMIHTTNSVAAPGMEMVLADAGWKVTRIIPFDDLAWIRREWWPEVRRRLSAAW
jgi:hypothetical protein